MARAGASDPEPIDRLARQRPWPREARPCLRPWHTPLGIQAELRGLRRHRELRRLACTTPAAWGVLQALQQGRAVPWASPLGGSPPSLPTGLDRYLWTAIARGRLTADRVHLSLTTHEIPRGQRKFVSGATRFARRFKSPSVNTFFVKLFHYIREHARTDLGLTVQLDGFDLYHGHLFTFFSPGPSPGGEPEAGLGVLFHAHEHPRELPYVGPRDMDPRVGSPVSTSQPDYGARNYLWLAPPNRVYLLDPLAPGFPAELETGTGFVTVDETAFNRVPLADINYFPARQDQPDPRRFYLAPRLGTPAEVRLANARSRDEVKEILSELSSDEVRDLQDRGRDGSIRELIRRLRPTGRTVPWVMVRRYLRQRELGIAALLGSGVYRDVASLALKHRDLDVARARLDLEAVAQIDACGFTPLDRLRAYYRCDADPERTTRHLRQVRRLVESGMVFLDAVDAALREPEV